jgi:hypothetical protein
MNDELLSNDDRRLLDLLVDGELNDAQRRELLLRLERSPDGWRRCAAAFLEAQAWRGETRAMTAPQAPAPSGQAKPQPASLASARPSIQIWMPLALAAGLLVATTWVFWNRNSDGPMPPGNMQAREQAAGDRSAQVAGDPRFVGPGGGSAENMQPPENLQLVVNGGPEGRRNVQVPLVDAGNMDEALFGQWSQPIPPEVIRMLEQNGHQVVRRRQLMPLELRDGRRVVLPMDQVEIRPANLQTFQ